MNPHFRPILEYARVASLSKELDAVLVEDGRHMHLFVVSSGQVTNNCYPLLVLIGYEHCGRNVRWLEEGKLKIEGSYQDFPVLSDVRVKELHDGLEISFDFEVVCR